MNLNDFLKKARKEGRALGQFNFCTVEQLKGIALAAKQKKAPVICGTSARENEFIGTEEAVALVSEIRKKEKVDLFLNFDHGKDIGSLKKAIDAGYEMVHFDGSKLSFEENVRATKEIASYAKKKGALVEGELSEIKGSSAINEGDPEEFTLTSIEKIVKFIKETSVHGIALDIGNVHGIYKKMPDLKLERISQLLSFVDCFIVLHGGSGISKEDIRKSIKNGVVKININTELRYAWRNSVGDFLENNSDEIVPYKILSPAREAIKKKVEEKIDIFNYA